MKATTLHVALPPSGTDHSYDIFIGSGLLAEAGAAIADRLGQRTCLIVSDTNVAAHYAAPLIASLTAAGHRCLPPLLIPPGEGSKNFAHFTQLAESALAQKPDRKALIVALGGGVVGDMAGLLAALLLRGIEFVQIPTTLLAQVDSSVGGKTGIDSAHGKNLIGAFYQPRLVLADTAVLQTLPARERAAGFAEVIKYGLIDQPDFFRWCEQHGVALLAGDSGLLAEAVRVSCASKATIVAADEREAGKRALLNLGHTFGHALEVVTGFGDGLLHGEAVAIGCALAIRYSIAQGHCPTEVLPRYAALCHACKLPTRPNATVAAIPQLLQAMAGDKKNRDGAVTLILLRGIGQAFVQPGVSLSELEDFWRNVLTA
ncbi:MAG: 3-dehydroquinate synthase [Alphaproteobacteria bacterium]|nr:3-dehydroquinate synthase [Alphaproteobacteria bacterium]